ncbi:MAG: hypothetical protein WCQ63_01380 [Methanomethylophilus sp.]
MVYVLKPEEVRAKYGSMFCQEFLTMVDEKAGKAKIVETCLARGPAEWDLVNRRRASGVIDQVKIEGTTLMMDVHMGEKELNFGPVSASLGGQGLKKLVVEGDTVRTTWMGIAGASVGVGACLPQARGVIRTEYPDDFKIGGGHTSTVDIITPKMVRIVIGVDDTDTKEKGATWAAALKVARDCPVGRFIDHKIIQLNPKSPTKTTNCCATAISFAVTEEDVPKLIEYCRDALKKASCSTDAVMTVFQGLEVPKALRDFGWSAKSVLYTQEEARKVAEAAGVQIISLTGINGIIGAIAAVGCCDLGAEAAGVPEDFA